VLRSYLPNKGSFGRLNADGILDGTFQIVESPAGGTCFAMQSNDKIILGGYNLQNSQVLARLNADASLDGTFAPTFAIFNGYPLFVSEIAVQKDQKITIAGEFQEVDGVPCTNMARLEPDGSLDASFQPPNILFDYGGTPEPPGFFAMVLQSDGKLIIGGNLTTINGVGVSSIARLNTDGSLDSSFNPPSFPYGTIDSIVIQSNGNVLVAGLFSLGNSNGIVRLLPDGELDPGFQETISWMGLPETRVQAVALQPDGKVLIGGLFDIVNGVNRNGIARLNADGTLDDSFNSNLAYGSEAVSVEVQTNGQLIIEQCNTTAGANPEYQLVRLNADGSLDPKFQTVGSVAPYGSPIQSQSDGKLVFLGYYTALNSAAQTLVRVFGSDFPPILKNLSLTPTQANLKWRAISNRCYRVQYVSDLSSTNWTDLPGDVYATGNTASKSDSGAPGVTQRFYRVTQLP
jgi:uncharacterized delta-60 repeat protein